MAKRSNKMKAKIYAPVTGSWEAPGGGRKKTSKIISHRLLRAHLKNETKKEVQTVR